MRADENVTVEETARAGVYVRRRLTQVERWSREGVVPGEYAQAAETFFLDYRAAHPATSRASWSIERVDGGGRGDGTPVCGAVDAERRLRDAIRVVGPAGADVLISVVGQEDSLREYAARLSANGRLVNPHEAKGLLLASLSTLARHYGFV
jgi:hypothetical protein